MELARGADAHPQPGVGAAVDVALLVAPESRPREVVEGARVVGRRRDAADPHLVGAGRRQLGREAAADRRGVVVGDLDPVRIPRAGTPPPPPPLHGHRVALLLAAVADPEDAPGDVDLDPRRPLRRCPDDPFGVLERRAGRRVHVVVDQRQPLARRRGLGQHAVVVGERRLAEAQVGDVQVADAEGELLEQVLLAGLVELGVLAPAEVGEHPVRAQHEPHRLVRAGAVLPGGEAPHLVGGRRPGERRRRRWRRQRVDHEAAADEDAGRQHRPAERACGEGGAGQRRQPGHGDRRRRHADRQQNAQRVRVVAAGGRGAHDDGMARRRRARPVRGSDRPPVQRHRDAVRDFRRRYRQRERQGVGHRRPRWRR